MSDVLPLRCVVVGKTGVGKSSFCNLMVGIQIFATGTSGSSVTRNPQKEAVVFSMNHYEFIDFPGYFDTSLSNEKIDKILGKLVELSLPGPDVFLHIISIAARFTDEDINTLLRLEEKFGYEVFKYMVVIFTCKNNLSHSNQSQEQYIVDFISNLRHGKKQPEHIKYLIDILDEGRYAFVECYGEGNEGRSDAFAVIDQLKTQNGDEHYTNSMYEKAVEKKRQVELDKQNQVELERQRRDDAERRRQDDAERKLRDEYERKMEVYLARQKQLDMERQRQVDDERQRQDKLERQQQDDAERKRLDEMKREILALRENRGETLKAIGVGVLRYYE